MIKKITDIHVISAKHTPKYDIRKEHVTYSDGTTEDRLACYTPSGKYLGGIREAEKIVNIPDPVTPEPKIKTVEQKEMKYRKSGVQEVDKQEVDK